MVNNSTISIRPPTASRSTGCILLLMVLLSSGCAAFRENNRPLTNYLDSKINPETTTGKVALAPVAVPLGFCSLTLDAAVAYPVAKLPGAVNDTTDIVWRNPSGGYMREVFLFAPKVVITPVVFTGVFIGKGYFDL